MAGGLWLPVCVLLVGVGLSAMAAWSVHEANVRKGEQGFDQRVERLAFAIEDQLNHPAHALRGLSALLTVQPQLTQDQFASYIHERRMTKAIPGVRGFGWNPRVPRNEASAYENAQRAEGGHDYKLRSLGDDTHEDLFPVQWNEPSANNAGTLGVDIGSEPHRRAAVEQAARSGEVAISNVIGLIQDRQRRGAFVLVVPSYWPQRPQQTEAQRVEALRGVVVAPVIASELLARVTSENALHLSFEIREASAVATSAKLFYDSTTADGLPRASTAGPELAAGFLRTQPLPLLGRNFELRVRSTPEFDASVTDRTSIAVFAVGLAGSLFLASLSAQLVRRRRTAEGRADRMAEECDRLAMVARLTSNAVVMTDAQRRITWVNASFERLTGYNADEVLGRTARSFLLFEGTDPATVQRLDEAMQAGRSVRCELLSRSKAGRTYWTMKEIQPVHDSAGQLAGFMSIETDITDRIQAEATIRSSQSLLETTGRIGSIGGWSIDLKTYAVELTQQTRRILDLPTDHEAKLTECLDWCAPQGRRRLEQISARGLAGGPSWDLELPFVTVQGRSIWVRLVAECEYDDRGVVRVVGALQDITSRRAIEAEASRNASLLRGAIDAIDEAFVLYDPYDRLVFCNDKYRAVYAASADLIVPGASFESIVRKGAERGQYKEALGRVDEWVAERMAAHRSGQPR